MNYYQFTYSTEEIIIILLAHMSHATSELKWNNYIGNRKKQTIPDSKYIMKTLKLNRWEKVRDIIKREWHENALLKDINDVQLKKDKLSVTVNKLIIKKQTESFKEHLTSAQSYNRYRSEHPELELPHFQSIIRVYGSWNDFKVSLGLKIHKVGRRQTYTDNELISILKKHRKYFTDATTWNNYAKHRSLPKFSLMRERIPREVILRYTNYGKRYSYTIEQLISIVNKHREQLTAGIRTWEAYATANQLPHYQTLVNKLGKTNVQNVINGAILTVDDVRKRPF